MSTINSSIFLDRNNRSTYINRSLDVVFSRFRDFPLTINPKVEAQMSYGIEHTLSLWSMRVTPVGFCLRVIVNEKPINLEKATSSVLSVIVN